MNNDNLISIIIPIYKVEKYIGKCIDSVLSQTFKEFELILVDDGSPDSCPAICDEYAKKDNRIKVIHKTNAGVADARNKGIDLANGKYIMFIDSDDWINEGCILDISKIILSTDVDLIIGYFKLIKEYEDGIVWKDNKFDITQINNQVSTHVLQYLTSTGLMPFPGQYILKRQFVIDKKLYFFDVLHEDIEWVPRIICSANSFWLYEKAFYFYRIRAESTTTAKTVKNLKAGLRIFEHTFDYSLRTSGKEQKEFLVMMLYWQMYPIYLNYSKFNSEEKILIRRWTKINIDKINIALNYNPKLHLMTKLFGVLYGVVIFKKLISLKYQINLVKKNKYVNESV
jgi:glycosyltransferase involved in cell wall biosynthesis